MKRLLSIIAAMSCAMAFVSIAQQPQTIADRSFALLRKNAPPVPEAFDFAVVADTRSLKIDQQSDTFKQLIHDFNALRPAFVLDVGDIILGGAADLVPAQWDEFERVTAELKVPLFPIIGNHDVFDAATEKIWQDRVGPTCYAFTYGNSRFIAMNSEENGVVDKISDSQLGWLKRDLESHKAKNIFVFLHQPYFSRDWNKQWAGVHKILRQHPVRMVFGGDEHMYRYIGNRDGIDYVISAGGGAEVRVPEDKGGFHHFVLVQVRGEKVDWSVIKPGSVLPKDVVTQARVDEVDYARTKWISTETVEVPFGEKVERALAVTLENRTDKPLEGEVVWSVPAGWHVEPITMKYSIPAKTPTADGFQVSEPMRAKLDFAVRADDGAASKYPVPELKTVFTGAIEGPPIEVTSRLKLIPTYVIHKAASPITVDGDLAEWAAAPQIPLPYGWDYDVKDTNDNATSIQMMWDAENLYLAATVKDDEFYQPYAGDVVWSADNLQLFFRMEDHSSAPYVFNYYWEYGLSLTTKGPEVFMYHGVNRESIVVNPSVKLAVKRAGEYTYYEAQFPKSEVLPLSMLAGGQFMFSIASNDLDPSHADRPRHWSELTPGVGDAVPGSPLAKFTLAE